MISYNYKRIGVLSDTHLRDIKKCADLAEKLTSGPFKNVDAIIHAGDHTCPELESCFYPKPWFSVRGNMDSLLVDVPQYLIFGIHNFKVGVIHGWGSPYDIEQRILESFAAHSLDVIIYGHSHYPACHMVANTLMFNPGSPTDKRHAPTCTVGILDFGDIIEGHHIEFTY